MEDILDAPRADQQRLQYAGFWIRFGAYFIDAVILTIVNFIIAFVVFGGYDPFAPNLALSGINIFLGVIYFVVMESSEKQGTIGKMAVGIKVGKENGERISPANALGRYFGKILSTLIILIGFIMVAWDERKQGLHDKLANTFVFYSK